MDPSVRWEDWKEVCSCRAMDEAKNRIESAKTKTGLIVTANIIQQTYEAGKKVAGKRLCEKFKNKIWRFSAKIKLYNLSNGG